MRKVAYILVTLIMTTLASAQVTLKYKKGSSFYATDLTLKNEHRKIISTCDKVNLTKCQDDNNWYKSPQTFNVVHARLDKTLSYKLVPGRAKILRILPIFVTKSKKLTTLDLRSEQIDTLRFSDFNSQCFWIMEVSYDFGIGFVDTSNADSGYLPDIFIMRNITDRNKEERTKLKKFLEAHGKLYIERYGFRW